MDPLDDYPNYGRGYPRSPSPERYVRDGDISDSIDSVGPRRRDNDNTGFLLHSTISRDEADGSKAPPPQPTRSMDAPEFSTPGPRSRPPINRYVDPEPMPQPLAQPYSIRERGYYASPPRRFVEPEVRRSRQYYAPPRRPYTSRSPQYTDGYRENDRYMPQAGYEYRYAPERTTIQYPYQQPPIPRRNKGNKFAPPSSYGHQYEADEEFPPDDVPEPETLEEDLDDFYGDHQLSELFEEASLEAEPPKPSVRFAQRSTHAKDGPNSAHDANGFSKPQKKPANSKKQVRASTYRIFCRIECHQSREEDEDGRLIHPAVIFEDVPQWNPRFKKTNPHLTGRRPIFHLSTYLSTRRPLSFIIFRNYSCTDANSRSSVSPPNGVRAMPIARMQDDEKREIVKESLEIKSETLEAAIKKVARCKMNCFIAGPLRDSPGHADLDYGLEKLSFDSPYLFLYHHRLMLNELSKKEEEPIRREILSLLIYLKERENALYKESDELLAKGKTSAKLLKFLFCPNEIVVTCQSGIEIAYAIKELYVNPSGSVRLKCWAWVYGGAALKRQGKDLQVSCRGDQTIAITDLPTYPLRFASQEIKDRLVKRGGRFWELRMPQLVTYRGMNFLQERYISEQRCMLDYQTYQIMHPDAEIFTHGRPENAYEYDNLPESISNDTELTDEQKMLCPPNIHGYLLKGKTWVNLLVENVYLVTWNKDAFKRLVLPHGTKDVVEALIKAHASADWKQGGLVSGKRLDLIAGKGLGLIMLLHGSPGTGKTLTAESVAEIAEMPLYSVTCGDIGIQVERVERYLETVLYLGKTWNCVLLLDEADVFLEERSLSDMQRNSLVSVFLRILEYYEGILILTSNRVGTFDEAFRSRIQLALHYPKLTPDFRKKIWQNFIDILREDEEDADIAELESHLEELSEREMNGREIRNALTSARQLASYKGVTLQWKHLQETLKIGKVFIDYLRDIHGHTDEDWAREERLR